MSDTTTLQSPANSIQDAEQYDRRLFSGLDKIKEVLDPAAQQQLTDHFAGSEDPEEDTAGAVNMAWAARQMKRDPDEITTNWPLIRDEVAATVTGKPQTNVTEKALYGMIGQHLQKMQTKRQMVGQLSEAMDTAAFSGQDWLTAYREFSPTLSAHAGYDANEADNYRVAAKARYDAAMNAAPRVGPLAARLAKFYTSTTANGYSDTDAAIRDGILNDISALPKVEQQSVFAYAGMHAAQVINQAKQNGTAEDSVGSTLTTALDRGISSLGSSTIRGAGALWNLAQAAYVPGGAAIYLAPGNRMTLSDLSAQMDRTYAEVAAKLPAEHWYEKAGYGTASMLPQVAATAVNPTAGIGILALSMGDNAAQDLIAKGVDPAKAHGIGLVTGGVQAALFGQMGKMITGAMPGVDAAMAKLFESETRNAGQLFTKTITAGALNIGVANVDQALVDATPDVIQNVASKLDSTIPGVDWNEAFNRFKGSRLDTFLTLAPLGMVSTGHFALNENARMRALLSNPDITKALGVPDVVAQRMQTMSAEDASNALAHFAYWKSAKDSAAVFEAEMNQTKSAARSAEVFLKRITEEDRANALANAEASKHADVLINADKEKPALGSLIGEAVTFNGYKGKLVRDSEGNFMVMPETRRAGSPFWIEVPDTGKDPASIAADFGVHRPGEGAQEIQAVSEAERAAALKRLDEEHRLMHEQLHAALGNQSDPESPTSAPEPRPQARAEQQEDGSYVVFDGRGQKVDHAGSAPEAAGLLHILAQSVLDQHKAATAEAQRMGLHPGNNFAVLSKVLETVRSLFDSKSELRRGLAGESAPKTSAVDEEAGNALVRHASSNIAAPLVAEVMASHVLGDHATDLEFSRKLGAVLTEDRLRAIRRSFERLAKTARESGDTAKADEFRKNADNVSTLVGSAFKNEAEFLAAVKDPEIQAAIARHKATVEEQARTAHLETGGELAASGPHTGAFVNLDPVLEQEALGKKGFATTLKRKTRFDESAQGSGDEYQTDYRDIALRMVKGNFVEQTKRRMYAALVDAGLAIEQPAGAEQPQGVENFTRLPEDKRGGALWVNNSVVHEVSAALNVDGEVERNGLASVAQWVNRIQLAAPTDAVFHTANILSAVAGAPGGKSMIADLARKLPGVNFVDASARVISRAQEVLRNAPGVADEVAHLAEIGAMRREREHQGPLIERLANRYISVLDKAGRLVLADLHGSMVERGLVTYSESGHREFVNQVGQYNGRLMSRLQRVVRDSGVAPFVVAGRAFNRMGFRRVLLAPGVEGADTRATLQMRATQALGSLATLLVVPAAFNYLTTGKVQGRPGTPVGAIDTGQDDEHGNRIIVDVAQWNGLRRGLRITGLNSLMRGAMEGQSTSRTVGDGIRDVIAGQVHPWAGPLPTAASILATGYDPGMHRQADPQPAGADQFVANAKAAALHANPAVAAFVDTDGPHGGGAGAVLKSLTGAVGVKAIHGLTAEGQVYAMLDRFREKEGTQAPVGEHSPSIYTAVKRALREGDHEAAKSEMLKVLGQRSVVVVLRHFNALPHETFAGSRVNEAKFVASLSDEQKTIYHEALVERAKIAHSAIKLLGELSHEKAPTQ